MSGRVFHLSLYSSVVCLFVSLCPQHFPQTIEISRSLILSSGMLLRGQQILTPTPEGQRGVFPSAHLHSNKPLRRVCLGAKIAYIVSRCGTALFRAPSGNPCARMQLIILSGREFIIGAKWMVLVWGYYEYGAKTVSLASDYERRGRRSYWFRYISCFSS